MKEYQSVTGGRHLYNSDFKNLQELALASFEIFKDCGKNFVVSGCTVDDGVVSAGYAFIDGKMRIVPQTSVSSTTNLFIKGKEVSGPTISYADGNTYPQYTEYTAEVVVVSAAISGSYIQFDTTLNRFPNIADVFFNEYVFVKGATAQSVSAATTFSQTMIANGIKNLSSDSSKNCLFYVDDSGNACFAVRQGDVEKTTYKLGEGVLSAYVGSTLLWQIGGTDGTIVLPSIQTSNITVNQKLSAEQVDTTSIKAESATITGAAECKNATVDKTLTANDVVSENSVKTPMTKSVGGQFNQIAVNTELSTSADWEANDAAMSINAPSGIALLIQKGFISGINLKIKVFNQDTYTIADDDTSVMFVSTWGNNSEIYLPSNPHDGKVLIIGRGATGSNLLTVRTNGNQGIFNQRYTPDGLSPNNYVNLASAVFRTFVYSQNANCWYCIGLNY